MDMNVAGISPMDGVTPVSRIGTYSVSQNSGVVSQNSGVVSQNSGVVSQNSGVDKVKPGATDSSQPAVKLSLSPEAKKLLKATRESANGQSEEVGNPKRSVSGRDDEQSKADQESTRKLQTRDLHVKMHEQQHLASAGAYAKGGATFTYQIGPDGKAYAIGGEVQLDIGPVPNNPQATITKAQIIRRSALAPADPSGSDRAIAAAASQMEAAAKMQLLEEAKSEKKSKIGSSVETDGTQRCPFQLKAYQKMMNGFGMGRHFNFLA